MALSQLVVPPGPGTKAGRVLDLYAGIWHNQALGPRDYVISADEKTSIQARRRRHPSAPPVSGQIQRVEPEYERHGALVYLAAWDVRRARLFGRCEARNGIASFDRLVADVMSQQPYRSAERVFWILDNGSAHRGAKAVRRLQTAWPNLHPVFTPVHASWMNQIEIYFSILQRKVLTPNNFNNLDALADQILSFQNRYMTLAQPFEWRFTRQDLTNLLNRYATVQAAA